MTRPSDIATWVLGVLTDDGATTRELAAYWWGCAPDPEQLHLVAMAVGQLRERKKLCVLGKRRDPVIGRTVRVWGIRREPLVKNLSMRPVDYAHNGDAG